ncbi:MAG: hypothetical protein CMQ45_00475 [Gammaproteobacteria bacterium]|nr:hypothetical protein [Gammaproteobacteria bacterium]
MFRVTTELRPGCRVYSATALYGHAYSHLGKLQDRQDFSLGFDHTAGGITPRAAEPVAVPSRSAVGACHNHFIDSPLSGSLSAPLAGPIGKSLFISEMTA